MGQGLCDDNPLATITHYSHIRPWPLALWSQRLCSSYTDEYILAYGPPDTGLNSCFTSPPRVCLCL